ncbi:EamA family transporter [Pseudovibrio exalbescens]|uniref:aromatic amino acid exporter YddG n=1 Tax=Pseudovibrio exalbescens TaxID=197461 RepID=UPI0023673CC4|nr:EamA family transporter [Pseudovibrio exalbescens]MDD7909469.1 EamA family transporter [Pseudovibrio exalbescens]
MGQITRNQATAIGFTAVIMWSFLGPFGALSGEVPPFLLNALCFTVSASLAFARLAINPSRLILLRQPLHVWVMGTMGLFGYHALYFIGIRNAPPVEANLINYLWPVLIVLFSALLPGERLRVHHVIGAGLGLAGAGLLIARGGAFDLSSDSTVGYAAALAAALAWSSYSVLSRRMGNVPTEAVAGFCLMTAILSYLCHFLFEQTVMPQGPTQWFAVVGMGLMPLGLSFFTWDIGMKRGDIQVLGASAYAAPLFSTLLLVLFGFGAFTWPVAAACALIVAGALFAAKDMILRKKYSAS